MTEPYIKTVPNEETGHLHIVVDQAGFELFQRLLSRAVPRRNDDASRFNAFKERVSGAFFAGEILMKWKRK